MANILPDEFKLQLKTTQVMTKIIFKMSKKRPFFLLGTNEPILNAQKTFILRCVPTGLIHFVIVA